MAEQERWSKVDLHEVTAALQAAWDKIAELQGRAVKPELIGRERSAALAEITRELLHLAHLCRRAETFALDQYHEARGHS